MIPSAPPCPTPATNQANRVTRLTGYQLLKIGRPHVCLWYGKPTNLIANLEASVDGPMVP